MYYRIFIPILLSNVIQDDARYGVKLDQGSTESESDSEMYPPPEGVDCDFSMEDSMGLYP